MKVKKMKWWLCLCSLLVAGVIKSQDVYEVNRTISKTYGWTERSRVEIENKYGDVILEIWDQDSVKVDVEIAIESKKWETAQEMSDMAVVSMSQQGSFIVARTDWGGNSSLWGQAKHEVRSVFGKDHKVEITYKVYAPQSTSVEIRNKFGDVFIPDFDGEVIAEVSHGDLRSPRISNPHRVSVEYGNAKVDEWGSGTVNLLFAEMRSEKAVDLRITSKSSKIYLDKARTLNLDSRNDELFLGEVDSVKGICHFSSTSIKVLKADMDLKQEYGDLTVRSISPEFSAIKVSPKRSKIVLRVGETTGFNYSVVLINGERFASVPELLTITKDEGDEDQRLIQGYWYKDGTGKSIRVEGEKSTVEIARD